MKTFYKQVLKEYRQSDKRNPNLCYGSITFRSFWVRWQKSLIRDHAIKFLLEKDFFPCEIGGESYLFHTYDSNYSEQIRTEFLKWCIENKLDIPG